MLHNIIKTWKLMPNRQLQSIDKVSGLTNVLKNFSTISIFVRFKHDHIFNHANIILFQNKQKHL